MMDALGGLGYMAIAFNRAREARDKIRRHSKKCLVIHYACQSLYDDREGLSPSISNIVVKDFDNGQIVSFAAHLIAEKLRINRDAIAENFPEIEKALLEEFYDFVRDHTGNLWLHWNMTSIQFGFETISHRYNVLTGKNAPGIDIDDRINIDGVLWGLYGENYVSNPRMQKLMEVNGGLRRNFVAGVDEVELFKQAEFARLNASTICKVSFFSDVVELVLDRKLKTERATLYVKIERATDHVLAKLLGLGAAIYTIVDLSLRAFR